jgi:hypothetical protein
MSGEGGWSSRAVAQRRLRVSKPGLKEPPYFDSSEIAVEAARRGASWQIKKKGYFNGISVQKRELDNSSKLNRIRAKGSPPEKNTTIKKELLT